MVPESRIIQIWRCMLWEIGWSVPAGWLVPATATPISWWAPTCDSMHSQQFYSLAPLGNQAEGTMIQFPTQPHYPDTELTSPCPILLLLSTKLGSDKYQVYKSLVWLDQEPNSGTPTSEACALPIFSPVCVWLNVYIFSLYLYLHNTLYITYLSVYIHVCIR